MLLAKYFLRSSVGSCGWLVGLANRIPRVLANRILSLVRAASHTRRRSNTHKHDTQLEGFTNDNRHKIQ